MLERVNKISKKIWYWCQLTVRSIIEVTKEKIMPKPTIQAMRLARRSWVLGSSMRNMKTAQKQNSTMRRISIIMIDIMIMSNSIVILSDISRIRRINVLTASRPSISTSGWPFGSEVRKGEVYVVSMVLVCDWGDDDVFEIWSDEGCWCRRDLEYLSLRANRASWSQMSCLYCRLSYQVPSMLDGCFVKKSKDWSMFAEIDLYKYT